MDKLVNKNKVKDRKIQHITSSEVLVLFKEWNNSSSQVRVVHAKITSGEQELEIKDVL